MDDMGSGRAGPSGQEGRNARYEVTLHRGERHVSLKELPALGLDRLPTPPGEVRLLVTLEEAARLVQLGFEVRLLRAHPTRPLDGALVMDDDTARAEFEERVRGVERKGES